MSLLPLLFFFFFNDTATTEIYTLSLHDALPILPNELREVMLPGTAKTSRPCSNASRAVIKLPLFSAASTSRSEEHTSELQSLAYLVCRLLLEKKKNTTLQR